MADSSLFRAKRGVKLTVRRPVPKIAPMPSRIWRLVLAAAATAACHEGLQPTPTCPPGFVGICGLVTVLVPLPDSLKDTTEAVFIVAYKNFPTAPESLFNFLPLPPPTVPTSTSDRKSTRLNSSHLVISYAVFCLKKKKTKKSRE